MKRDFNRSIYAVEISFFNVQAPIFDIASAVRIMVDLRFPRFFSHYASLTYHQAISASVVSGTLYICRKPPSAPFR